MKDRESLLLIDETNSTNQYLQNLNQSKKLLEGTSVIASFQSAGKGNAENSWESEKGKNILLSTIFFPTNISPYNQFVLSEIACISVLQLLQNTMQELGKNYVDDFSIKWPNDVYWKNKKIVGILIECQIQNNIIEQCIIGIGVNINQECFSENLPNPVSLKQITNKEFDIHTLAIQLIQNLYTNYLKILKNELNTIHSIYKENLYWKSGLHQFRCKESGTFNAYIKNVDPTGTILLEKENGDNVSYMFKEIEFLIPK